MHVPDSACKPTSGFARTGSHTPTCAPASEVHSYSTLYHHFKLFQTLIYWFFPSSMSLWQHSSGTQWNCKNSASLLICKLTRLHTDFQQKIPFDDKSTCFIKQRNYWRHTSIYWHSHIIFFLSCFSIITNDHNSKIVVWWYAEKLFQHNKHPRWCASQL